MARVLLVCSVYPENRPSGEYLRLNNFCKLLSKHHECYLVFTGDVVAGQDPKKEIGVRDYACLPSIPTTKRSFRRHLRVSDASFLRLGASKYLKSVQAQISELCERWAIEMIYCLAPQVAEMVLPIQLPKALDCCDSITLTLRRMKANRTEQLSIPDIAILSLKMMRLQGMEDEFVRKFDLVTTISDADKQCLLEISGAAASKVLVIPNGVSGEALIAGRHATKRNRSLVFWGNLDFPPNWTAIQYFFNEIYLPYFSDENLEWHIFGGGAGEQLSLLASHPNVHLHGYVQDLYMEARKHGVMINPMVEGSGLKNKVLEAFACSVPVVSTSVGIEAVNASPGVHYLLADKPSEFSNSIKQILSDEALADKIAIAARDYVTREFNWEVIGKRLSDIIENKIASSKEVKIRCEL